MCCFSQLRQEALLSAPKKHHAKGQFSSGEAKHCCMMIAAVSQIAGNCVGVKRPNKDRTKTKKNLKCRGTGSTFNKKKMKSASRDLSL